jgi:hypothetical protein
MLPITSISKPNDKNSSDVMAISDAKYVEQFYEVIVTYHMNGRSLPLEGYLP